jgi:hypothetical protein
MKTEEECQHKEGCMKIGYIREMNGEESEHQGDE